MAKVKAGLPQGTRDFSAEVVRKRNYIFNTIRNVFELYGFQPLETPAMENLDTLMGKYGDEGDKLIFKILNNGLDRVEKHQKAREDFETVLAGKNVDGITERALRYDLTIPFARYVAMNSGQLSFPFKRYQIQPVWRADRPQKGRYREFYQCDADVVGSNSLLNEVELVSIYAGAFERLGIDVTIKINNRKILTGIAEIIEEPNKIIEITTAIDKCDKIGIQGVKDELRNKGFTEEKISKLNDLIFFEADRILLINATQISFLKNGTEYSKSKNYQQGIEELEYIINYCEALNIANVKIDLSLARGLNYYTGTILEIKANGVQMGSIGGGGRYDDLTGLFGVPNLPGVGISFGVDRIYDVMEELKLFPEDVQVGTQVLFFNLGEAESKAAYNLVQQLRNSGVRCEIYPEQSKFDKQFKYADKKNIPYAVIIGTKELEEGNCTIKNLKSGEQQTVAQAILGEMKFDI